MKYVQKLFLKKIYVRSKLSCVRSPHDLCVRAHAHSLEGTLVLVFLRISSDFPLAQGFPNFFGSGPTWECLGHLVTH